MNPSETFEPTKIYENPNLGVFIVDYTNFQLIAPVHNDNTVISISFDGYVKHVKIKELSFYKAPLCAPGTEI